MKLSHILYKVDDLHQAVKDFQEMGFTVEYGAKPDKAFNALIWFEQGPFIELFYAEPHRIINFIVKILGLKGIVSRFKLFQYSNYGWTDYSLENDRIELQEEALQLKKLGYKFSKIPGFRTNIHGTKLKWKLLFPVDTTFPFFMSAYRPNPRPKIIKHPNGAKEVKQVIWGTTKGNIPNIRWFSNDERLQLVEGKGFQKIVIDGWDADVLNKSYYKD